jgi:hypothetical protein
VQYESNPKHSEPWQAGRKGSLCPKNLKPLALELLMESDQVGRERFVFHEGKAYCAKEHRADVWHGYPVGWIEVPAELRNRWKRAGSITKKDINRFWEGHS